MPWLRLITTIIEVLICTIPSTHLLVMMTRHLLSVWTYLPCQSPLSFDILNYCYLMASSSFAKSWIAQSRFCFLLFAFQDRLELSNSHLSPPFDLSFIWCVGRFPLSMAIIFKTRFPFIENDSNYHLSLFLTSTCIEQCHQFFTQAQWLKSLD